MSDPRICFRFTCISNLTHIQHHGPSQLPFNKTYLTRSADMEVPERFKFSRREVEGSSDSLRMAQSRDIPGYRFQDRSSSFRLCCHCKGNTSMSGSWLVITYPAMKRRCLLNTMLLVHLITNFGSALFLSHHAGKITVNSVNISMIRKQGNQRNTNLKSKVLQSAKLHHSNILCFTHRPVATEKPHTIA